MRDMELLAPAGDLEKLIIACDYGADAVYFGGEMFSLREGAGNFTMEDMREGIAYAHSKGVRCYLTVNIYAHSDDLEPLEKYLEEIKDLDIDGFILSDPGVIRMIKRVVPGAVLHLSTQANTTNYATAQFWYDIGISRIVVARELTLGEIKAMKDHIPEDMEIEAFCHGAMCISYSGRCLLSNYMTGRDANRGQCSHPCRWKYRLEEEQRPGEYYPVEEDSRGTYIMNSKDLCMLEHIEDMRQAGVSSLKIEGRMKSIFYVASVVRAYRACLDRGEYDEKYMKMLTRASHREFTTGFFYDRPTGADQNYLTSDYTREYSFTGLVKDWDDEAGIATVEQRNKMSIGDRIEVFGPDEEGFDFILEEMYDEDGEPLESAPHPQQILRIKVPKPVGRNYMFCVRK